jgi:hypothetical protein
MTHQLPAGGDRRCASDRGLGLVEIRRARALPAPAPIGEVNKSQFEEKQRKQIMSGSKKIEGYTWHHHQDTGRMQLVPEQLHRETGHIGWESMSKGK